MQEAEHYTDHDLLILIAERTRVGGEKLENHEGRITALERKEDQRTGFAAGGKLFWSLVTGLPAVVVTIGILAAVFVSS